MCDRAGLTVTKAMAAKPHKVFLPGAGFPEVLIGHQEFSGSSQSGLKLGKVPPQACQFTLATLVY